MNYFRGLLAVSEISERGLQLSNLVISLNSANYTAWHYRRVCLFALNKDLVSELLENEVLADATPKNYQLWYHRRAILEKLDDIGNELKVTEDILKRDNKNYHVWSHRQWAIARFQKYEGELNFTTLMLDLDLRNNSAWNHRFYVIKNTTKFTESVIEREITFTLAKIEIVVGNESSWSYFVGLCREAPQIIPRILPRLRHYLDVPKTDFVVNAALIEDDNASKNPDEINCEEVTNTSVTVCNGRVYALTALVQICEFVKDVDAVLYCDKLIEEDPIRAKFWQQKRKELAFMIV